jgi:hypothetical protein
MLCEAGLHLFYLFTDDVCILFLPLDVHCRAGRMYRSRPRWTLLSPSATTSRWILVSVTCVVFSFTLAAGPERRVASAFEEFRQGFLFSWICFLRPRVLPADAMVRGASMLACARVSAVDMMLIFSSSPM